jgi:hypothetical protein
VVSRRSPVSNVASSDRSEAELRCGKSATGRRYPRWHNPALSVPDTSGRWLHADRRCAGARCRAGLGRRRGSLCRRHDAPRHARRRVFQRAATATVAAQRCATPGEILCAVADAPVAKQVYEIITLFSLVRSRGLEPPRCYPLAPQASASTNSATTAFVKRNAGKHAGAWRRACNKSVGAGQGLR